MTRRDSSAWGIFALALAFTLLAVTWAGPAGSPQVTPTRIVIHDHGRATVVERGSARFQETGAEAARLVQAARSEVAALALPWEAAERCKREQVAVEVLFAAPGVRAGVHGEYTAALIPVDEMHEPDRVHVYLGTDRYTLLVPADADEELARLCELAGVPAPPIQRGPLPPTVAPASPSSSPAATPQSTATRAEASPTPRPGIALPDLAPPPGGWIACLTSMFEPCLVLVSPDGSRHLSLDEPGVVYGSRWSPDGRWLAALRQGGEIRRDGLGLISIEQSRALPPRGPIQGMTWSRDGRWLAYIAGPDDGPFAVCLFETSSGQTVTVTTYPEADGPEDIPWLCSDTCPSSLLPVFHPRDAEFAGVTVDIWDVRAGSELATFHSAGRSCGEYGHLWLPGGEGLIFTQEERGKEPVYLSRDRVYPVSLAFWRPGMEAPVVVLEAAERQSYRPLRWLPDGRLEVAGWEYGKDRYESDEMAQPRLTAYRYFRVSAAGELREDDTDLPWWAGDGLAARLSEVDLPGPEGRLGDWDVAPDGRTVAFTWAWQSGDQLASAVYVWDGEGEPLRLCDGLAPRWQPMR